MSEQPHPPQPHGHHHPQGVHQDHRHGDDAGLAELLDLDGQVLHDYGGEAIGWVQQAAPDARRIVDLGAGSGVGTLALARRFPAAEVIAVDSSPDMLQRIRHKAEQHGLVSRIRVVEADLDEAWPDVLDVDLTWASLSLHHFADPDRVLSAVLAATAPGGVLAAAEFGERLRFLPDDVGAGLERRCLAVLGEEQAHSLPEIGADWPARFTAAGFGDVTERTFDIALDQPLPAGAVDYAQRWLERLRAGLADRLSADDLTTLEVLLDSNGPDSVRRRGDLRVRGSRRVTVGRHP